MELRPNQMRHHHETIVELCPNQPNHHASNNQYRIIYHAKTMQLTNHLIQVTCQGHVKLINHRP